MVDKKSFSYRHNRYRRIKRLSRYFLFRLFKIVFYLVKCPSLQKQQCSVCRIICYRLNSLNVFITGMNEYFLFPGEVAFILLNMLI